MDFTKQLITPEGEKWETDEQYTDEKGIIATKKVPLTFFRLARESLLGSKVGGRILSCPTVAVWRLNVFNKINAVPTDAQLTFFDKVLLKKLVALRFDIAPAAKLINMINGK